MNQHPATRVSEFRLKLYPSDFNKVRQFYENTLHYSVIKEWDRDSNDKGVMFDIGGGTLELLSPKSGHKQIQGVGVSWEVNDVRVLWEQLKDACDVVFVLRSNHWGDDSFCIRDPEGFEITFFTKH